MCMVLGSISDRSANTLRERVSTLQITGLYVLCRYPDIALTCGKPDSYGQQDTYIFSGNEEENSFYRATFVYVVPFLLVYRSLVLTEHAEVMLCPFLPFLPTQVIVAYSLLSHVMLFL